jgi:hypothetical protein
MDVLNSVSDMFKNESRDEPLDEAPFYITGKRPKRQPPPLRLQGLAGGIKLKRLYDGDELIAEYNLSGALLRRFVHGPGADEPLVWYEGSGTADQRWFHADERGSVIAVSDGAGALYGTINRYDEFGAPSAALTGRFGYTGQAALTPFTLFHYKARLYDPALGIGPRGFIARAQSSSSSTARTARPRSCLR